VDVVGQQLRSTADIEVDPPTGLLGINLELLEPNALSPGYYAQWSGYLETLGQAGNTTAVTAGSFVVGNQYEIVSTGTTSFTSIGAAANTPGTLFVATGVGTGTGTAVQTGFCTQWDAFITSTTALKLRTGALTLVGNSTEPYDFVPVQIRAVMLPNAAYNVTFRVRNWEMHIAGYGY
jgi:hypothetical protein